MARVSISLSTGEGSKMDLSLPSLGFGGCVIVDYRTCLPGREFTYDAGTLCLHGSREDLRGFADLIYAGTRTQEEIDAAKAEAA